MHPAFLLIKPLATKLGGRKALMIAFAGAFAGIKLAAILYLLHKRHVFTNPRNVGHDCSKCGAFINVNELARSFSAKMGDMEVIFTGTCKGCGTINSIPDSKLRVKK